MVILYLSNKKLILICPLDFNFYREQIIDLWGKKGRIEIFQEGLFYKIFNIQDHRAIENYNEIIIDKGKIFKTALNQAFFNLYNNLVNSIQKNEMNLSPIQNAIECEQIVEALFLSYERGFEKIYLNSNTYV